MILALIILSSARSSEHYTKNELRKLSNMLSFFQTKKHLTPYNFQKINVSKLRYAPTTKVDNTL